jgi:hypothetical protein
MSIREKVDFGFYGHSTIKHNYEPKTINGDRVIKDNATGLIWHQSGSSNSMHWNDARKWVRNLSSRGHAGYSDWRLPSVEEAASLLEPSKRNGDLYIDPVFDKGQRYIWTGDNEGGTGAAWVVIFDGGSVGWGDLSFDLSYVRPVRSGK